MTAKLEAMPASPQRFIPYLLVETGLRNNDARWIDLGQLSADGKWLMRVHVKGGKRINVPLSDKAAQELTLYREGWRNNYPTGDNTPLLVTKRGSRPSNKTIWQYVYDVTGEHPHALRHTFAYRYLEHLQAQGLSAGRAFLRLRDRLGHSSIQTTLRYLGNRQDEVWEEIRGMA